MRKKAMSIIFAFIVFFCFLLQTTVFKAISFGGINPNLLIVTTTSIGLMKGEKPGLIAGFFSGLLIDIFFGGILGLSALIYMWLGFLAGKFSLVFYPEDIKLPLFMITLTDLTYGMISYILTFLLRSRFNFSYYFVNIILPEMIYTIILGIILYPLMLFIYKRLNVEDNRSETDFV